jgi:hypothetical protein
LSKEILTKADDRERGDAKESSALRGATALRTTEAWLEDLPEEHKATVTGGGGGCRSHMQVNMQEVIPGRGKGQKMSRGWSVFRDEDRGKRVVLVRSPASRGVVPRHQDPNGWSAL